MLKELKPPQPWNMTGQLTAPAADMDSSVSSVAEERPFCWKAPLFSARSRHRWQHGDYGISSLKLADDWLVIAGSGGKQLVLKLGIWCSMPTGWGGVWARECWQNSKYAGLLSGVKLRWRLPHYGMNKCEFVCLSDFMLIAAQFPVISVSAVPSPVSQSQPPPPPVFRRVGRVVFHR